MSFFSKRFIPFYFGIFVFIADLLTKYLTNAHLPLMRSNWLWYPYGGIGIFKNFLGIEFSLSHQINHGAAWGVLADYQVPLLYLRMALIAFLLIYVLFFNKHPERNIPFALIIAGAAGNVVDYFLYGHVVDMFHFVLWGYDFPIFNLADSAIFIGVTYLLFLSLLESCSSPKKKVRRN
jgi:signal peptidase II